MHNHDDKYPSRPEFEPGTSRLEASVNTNTIRISHRGRPTCPSFVLAKEQWPIYHIILSDYIVLILASVGEKLCEI